MTIIKSNPVLCKVFYYETQYCEFGEIREFTIAVRSDETFKEDFIDNLEKEFDVAIQEVECTLGNFRDTNRGYASSWVISRDGGFKTL
mgnify:CR=1 FL=1